MRRLIGWIKPQQHSLSPQTSLWRKIKIGFMSLFVVATASTIGMAMLDREKLTNDLLTISGNAGLVVTDIQVRGRAHTPQSRLLAALDLQIGAPILGIDLQNLHRNISQIGWVEDAIIERRLPGTIHITLRERVPIALCFIDTNNDSVPDVNFFRTIYYGYSNHANISSCGCDKCVHSLTGSIL